MNWKLFGFYLYAIIGIVCATILFIKAQPCAAILVLLVVGGSSYKEMPPNSSSTQTAATAADDEQSENIRVQL